MHYIVLQGTYQSLELGLFLNDVVVTTVLYDHLRASSHLIPFLEQLLQSNNKGLADMAFIGVDHGPGAFTSLRATIASVNGIAVGGKIPLIGVNSLEALVCQANADTSNQATFTVALLNAYTNDVYFRIVERKSGELVEEEACLKIDIVLERLRSRVGNFFCVGNGITLFRKELEAVFETRLVIPVVLPAVPSVISIAPLALRAWRQQKSPVYTIEPYYLKTQFFAIKQ